MEGEVGRGTVAAAYQPAVVHKAVLHRVVPAEGKSVLRKLYLPAVPVVVYPSVGGYAEEVVVAAQLRLAPSGFDGRLGQYHHRVDVKFCTRSFRRGVEFVYKILFRHAAGGLVYVFLVAGFGYGYGNRFGLHRYILELVAVAYLVQQRIGAEHNARTLDVGHRKLLLGFGTCRTQGDAEETQAP